jgi:hypothetical protein
MKAQVGAIYPAMQVLVAIGNCEMHLKRDITEPLRVQPPPPPVLPPDVRVTMLPARECAEEMTNVSLDNLQR